MAYRIVNTDPLELDYKLAIGVKIPFVGAGSTPGSDAVFNSTFTTTEQIRSDLINWTLTNKGERILNPNYGSDLRRYLFSNITQESSDINLGLNDLQKSLTSGIQLNFPNISVKDITITPDYDLNSVNIKIIYSFMNSPTSTINITL
jgi:phage baseplate assembly protein W